MGRSINRDEHPTLDKWLTAIEGSRTPQFATGESIQCDFCESEIPAGVRFTSYLSDTLVNEDIAGFDGDGSPFYMLRAYCPDCDRQEILHPCRDYIEMLLEGELDDEYRLQNLTVIDFSTGDEGIPYDPEEVWEVTHQGMAWDEFQKNLVQLEGHPVRMGPADVTDGLLYHDVEPRDVFDPDGVIRLTDEDIEDIASQFR